MLIGGRPPKPLAPIVADTSRSPRATSMTSASRVGHPLDLDQAVVRAPSPSRHGSCPASWVCRRPPRASSVARRRSGSTELFQQLGWTPPATASKAAARFWPVSTRPRVCAGGLPLREPSAPPGWAPRQAVLAQRRALISADPNHEEEGLRADAVTKSPRTERPRTAVIRVAQPRTGGRPLCSEHLVRGRGLALPHAGGPGGLVRASVARPVIGSQQRTGPRYRAVHCCSASRRGNARRPRSRSCCGRLPQLIGRRRGDRRRPSPNRPDRKTFATRSTWLLPLRTRQSRSVASGAGGGPRSRSPANASCRRLRC
jgi:hypothetical protein